MDSINSDELKDLEQFFVVVNQKIKKHGIKAIIRAIEIIDLRQNNRYYELINEMILTHVSNEFVISKKEILSRDNRGLTNVARKIAIVLIKKYLKISDEDVGNQFGGCVRQTIYKIRMEINSYDRENKLDERFFERYDRINEKVVNSINEIKKY